MQGSRYPPHDVIFLVLSEHQTTNLGVGSSNLSRRASLRDVPCEPHGIHTAHDEFRWAGAKRRPFASSETGNESKNITA
jgi:hypothetical protein